MYDRPTALTGLPPRLLACLVACCVLAPLERRLATADDLPSIQRTIDLDLSLPSVDGQPFRLRFPSQARLRVLCFLGCECPVANLYLQRLGELASQYADQDIEFIGINSNPQDSIDKMVDHAAQHAVAFPMLKDHDGTVARTVGATRTPEVFLVDADGRVHYQGRVDDQYRPGVVTDTPGREDLRLAIEQSLSGRPIEVAKTPAAGCLIAKRRSVDPDAEVTFANQVSRVLQRHCTECHRAGEIGPFALSDYEEVVGWADMILEVVELRRMPPWHAAQGHAPLANARRMPQADIELLQRWVEAGTPFGDAADLPPQSEQASRWQLPDSPDLVLPMRDEPFTVPASGAVDYQYFVVDPGFSEDQWVTAAEIIPGNRSVVHHGIVFVRPPDGVKLDGLGWLTAYVPGQRLTPPVPYRARRVPAGSKLVFQMHYTPTGKVEQDLSTLGLTLADPDQVSEELLTLVGINQGLEIPPGEPAVEVRGSTGQLPDDGLLLAMSPHMHLRGKAFQVHARGPEASESLLHVPRYDFNWQHTYVLETPLPLADLRSLDFVATYDNSADNPFNPDPSEFVTWGDQTWEEMALVFYEVARPRTAETSADPPADAKASGDAKAQDDGDGRGDTERTSPPEPRSGDRTSDAARPPQHEGDLHAMTDELFADLDRDGNGVISYDEVDRAVQLRLFRHIDRNGDRQLERQEVLEYLRNRKGGD